MMAMRQAQLSPNHAFHGRASPSVCHIGILIATTSCLPKTVFQKGGTFMEEKPEGSKRWRRH